MEIETFFFDLGNVLVFFDHEKMHEQIAKLCDLDMDVTRTLLHSQLDSYERGTLSSAELHGMLCDLSKKEIPWNKALYALSDIFKPNVEMIPIIEKLKSHHKRLFILSNTCAPHFEFLLASYPFLHLFDGYILSYEVGARKPEKKIFEHALSLTDRSPCFYTDDIPEYVAAARALKLDAEVFTTADNLSQQLLQRGVLV